MKLILEWLGKRDGPLSPLIDENQIAVGGHSFGGFTALGVSGTLKEYHDARVKALLLLSTGAGGYLFTDEEIASVKIPSMLFLGDLERKALRGRDLTMEAIAEKLYGKLPEPKYLLWVKNAGHLSFCDQVTSGWKRPVRNNLAIFELVSRYAAAFLNQYVAGRKESEQILQQPDKLLTRYLHQP
ncbi:MAG: hypothetical protein NC823_00635 [Candidatus Omnitrophica bacterium]|nr:hypothetical protein [Candidatus Omnitrophota bacterium]